MAKHVAHIIKVKTTEKGSQAGTTTHECEIKGQLPADLLYSKSQIYLTN